MEVCRAWWYWSYWTLLIFYYLLKSKSWLLSHQNYQFLHFNTLLHFTKSYMSYVYHSAGHKSCVSMVWCKWWVVLLSDLCVTCRDDDDDDVYVVVTGPLYSGCRQPTVLLQCACCRSRISCLLTRCCTVRLWLVSLYLLDISKLSYR